jgi:hypothetical protein
VAQNAGSGWQVTVDGKPAVLADVDGALLGVVVPPGSHHVVFEYRPAAFAIGRAISFAANVIGKYDAFVLQPREGGAIDLGGFLMTVAGHVLQPDEIIDISVIDRFIWLAKWLRRNRLGDAGDVSSEGFCIIYVWLFRRGVARLIDSPGGPSPRGEALGLARTRMLVSRTLLTAASFVVGGRERVLRHAVSVSSEVVSAEIREAMESRCCPSISADRRW